MLQNRFMSKIFLVSLVFFALAAHAKPSNFDLAKKNHWETAFLAGGCFWGMEHWLGKLDGVIETDVGYTGGAQKTAKYGDVHTGKTGHAEAVRVLFDPKRLSYQDLLLYFFRIHDPTTLNRQRNDEGTQYRSAIFFSNPTQKAIAEKVKARVQKSGKWEKPLVTEITPAGIFVEAEP